MNEQAIRRLHDAFNACNRLQRLGHQYSRYQFLEDDILQLAVWKLVELVGEALHQADRWEPSLEESIPELRRIVDTRHRITHGYDSVNFSLLWDIVTYRIDPLIETLEEILDAETA